MSEGIFRRDARDLQPRLMVVVVEELVDDQEGSPVGAEGKSHWGREGGGWRVVYLWV